MFQNIIREVVLSTQTLKEDARINVNVKKKIIYFIRLYI